MNKVIYLSLFFLLPLLSCQNEKRTNKNSKNSLAELDIKKHSETELIQDFELLVNGLKDVHKGIYWYSTKEQFDSIVKIQRNQIKDSLNAVEFYNIAAPIISYTKEGHCNASLSEKTTHAIESNGNYLPFCIKTLNEQIYILNNYKNHKTQGLKFVSINGKPIKEITKEIFKRKFADGYIENSKYKDLDDEWFSESYALNIEQPETFEIELSDSSNNNFIKIDINSVSYKEFIGECRKIWNTKPFNKREPYLSLKTENSLAILNLNTFSNDDLKEDKLNFKKFISNSFKKIEELKITDLIIDIRKNTGGTEGNEDFLFSFLMNKSYNKYKFVEASIFNFQNYINYTYEDDWIETEKDLKSEQKINSEGRFLRKKDIEKQEPIKKTTFSGNVYILTSSSTYSGAAEFSSLMREHTNAIFIGEEVGGGYFGNTSGYGLDLILPNTEIEIHIPILQFVLDVEKGIFGRGVIPDFKITQTIKEHLAGIDAEMKFAKNKIE
ncbi:S41 family peptidase [Lacinutrix undariae]